MRKIVLVALLMPLVMLLSCTPSYQDILTRQIETDNVAPITLDAAKKVESGEPVVTFVITNGGISADSRIDIANLHGGAEADVLYIVKNETDVQLKPTIYVAQDTHISDYSVVEGQGYEDAPDYIDGWISISPDGKEIPPQSAQGYIVSFILPDDISNLPKKYAFQVGVAVGDKLQIAVSPWWLVSMR